LKADQLVVPFHPNKTIPMRLFGVLLLILGGGSLLLHQLNIEFWLLRWVDNWGVQNGNYIRIGMAVLGLLLIIVSMRRRRVV